MFPWRDPVARGSALTRLDLSVGSDTDTDKHTVMRAHPCAHTHARTHHLPSASPPRTAALENLAARERKYGARRRRTGASLWDQGVLCPSPSILTSAPLPVPAPVRRPLSLRFLCPGLSPRQLPASPGPPPRGSSGSVSPALTPRLPGRRRPPRTPGRPRSQLSALCPKCVCAW